VLEEIRQEKIKERKRKQVDPKTIFWISRPKKERRVIFPGKLIASTFRIIHFVLANWNFFVSTICSPNIVDK
jgi:hypothetical protein